MSEILGAGAGLGREQQTFGRLQRVDLRAGWQSEAQHFTPWLASEENLLLLGDALGIELELEAQERSVGPFKADILCKDTGDGSWVLIENQLERTDHTHLGQLITYAAGLQAVTIVWIAARFAEEHRAACDWLNEVTDAAVRVFALEVELWRIGSSPVAPKFNIVSKPNNWSRTVAAAKRSIDDGELSVGREIQLRYWTEVENRIREARGPLNAVRPQAQSWLTHGIGRTDFGLNLAMNSRDRWIRIEVYLSGDNAKRHFDALEAQKSEIEIELGAPLQWQRLQGKRDARIALVRQSVDPFDETEWHEQHQWLVENAGLMHRVFNPRIKSLQLPPASSHSQQDNDR